MNEEQKTHFCPNCCVAVLEEHPTLYTWLKCPVCGFCKEKPKKEKK